VIDLLEVRKLVKKYLKEFGFEVRKFGRGELDDLSRFVKLCKDSGVTHILDIGANKGQFAVDLRFANYSGYIISVEPTKDAWDELKKRAEKDAKWIVADRCGLGREASSMTINVSGNSYSSSFLPMENLHLISAPESEYTKVEKVDIVSLEELISSLGIPGSALFGLKLDTQGYEAEVLEGIGSLRESIMVLFTELSLRPLYTGALTFLPMFELISGLGYRCVGLSHEFSELKTGEMLQVNGTFIKGVSHEK
jgi:FkbM family methyltransferase